MMIITLIRLSIDLICIVCAIMGGLYYWLIAGDTHHAVSTVVICGIVAFVVRPNNADAAAYMAWANERHAGRGASPPE